MVKMRILCDKKRPKLQYNKCQGQEYTFVHNNWDNYLIGYFPIFNVKKEFSMKRTTLCAGVLVYMLLIGIKTADAQMVSLDDAIRNASSEFSFVIDRGATVAVIAMEATSVNMSNYIIDEMVAFLLRAGNFTVVDRAQLDLVRQELHFQMSADVDDATAQSIGRLMGVQYIIAGAFEPIGVFHRFIVRLIEVETAAIRGIYTANVQHDAIIAALMGEATTVLPSPIAVAPQPQSQPVPRVREVKDRVHFFSLEGSVWGGGLRYEWKINDIFSVGGNLFFNMFNDYQDTNIAGALGTARFFPGGIPFYLEIGVGLGMFSTDEEAHWDGSVFIDYSIHSFGLLIAPSVGMRIGGRTQIFFINPFISIPMVFSGEYNGLIGMRIRFGVGLGWAW